MKNTLILSDISTDTALNRQMPSNIRFYDMDGWMGVRCVDTTSTDDMVRLGFKEIFNYN